MAKDNPSLFDILVRSFSTEQEKQFLDVLLFVYTALQSVACSVFVVFVKFISLFSFS